MKSKIIIQYTFQTYALDLCATIHISPNENRENDSAGVSVNIRNRSYYSAEYPVGRHIKNDNSAIISMPNVKINVCND